MVVPKELYHRLNKCFAIDHSSFAIVQASFIIDHSSFVIVHSFVAIARSSFAIATFVAVALLANVTTQPLILVLVAALESLRITLKLDCHNYDLFDCLYQHVSHLVSKLESIPFCQNLKSFAAQQSQHQKLIHIGKV